MTNWQIYCKNGEVDQIVDFLVTEEQIMVAVLWDKCWWEMFLWFDVLAELILLKFDDRNDAFSLSGSYFMH